MKKRTKPEAKATRVSTAAFQGPASLPFPVVAVGASAGGLEAFSELVAAMPPQSGMALVFILHLPPNHKSLLTEILAPHTDMAVKQISDGMKLEANSLYVIRPGFTVKLKDGHFILGEPLERRGHRHPVDDFFRSLASEQKERAIGILLSGMGTNGTVGAQDIRAAGGLCIAQDPATAKYPSMPQSLIKSGRADFVLAPRAMPDVLRRYGSHPYVRGTFVVDGDSEQETALKEILRLLQAHDFPDFTGYKKPTLVRRIERRMGLRQIDHMPDYAALLRRDTEELAALADDLVINVTGFFRDAEVWKTLKEKVIVPLVKQKPNGAAVRAWVSACSSGEESYTVAMLILEAARAAGKSFDIKIFATDVARRQLAAAREGTFPAAIEDDVTPARLERFFERVDSVYRARKDLREMIVFAPHNLLEDPPFSRLDLCTCRNLLIYLEPTVQQRVLALMHFALNKDGVLLLGTSETVGGAEQLFSPIDKRARIYRRVGHTRHDLVDFPTAKIPGRGAAEGHADGRARSHAATVVQMTHQSLLQNYGPPAVVVDRGNRIVYFYGQTDRFIDQPRGEPTRELLMLVRDPLRTAVRRALQQSVAENRPARGLPAPLDFNGRRTLVSCRVAPLDPRPGSEYFLVSFEEVSDPTPAVRVPGRRSDFDSGLEQELRRVRDELQAKIGELQSNNEELKASNEETVSVNEELQSTNEELETSKEELQSLNEELTSVNSQLQAKMVELETATNDLTSLLSSTNIAVVFLDPTFHIRRFTPAVRDLLELIPQDIGRPLHNLAMKFADEHLLADAKVVLESHAPISREVFSFTGRAYLRSVLPYRTARNQVDGVVITFIDITDRQRAERELRESAEQHRLMLESLRDYAIFLLDADGMIKSWSRGAALVFGYSREEILGQPLSLIFPPEDDPLALADREMREARLHGSVSQEGWLLRKDGSRFWGRGVLSAAADEHGRLRGYVMVLGDDTERRKIEQDLRLAKQRAEAASEAKDQFLATVSHELRTPLSSILLWANLIDEGADMEAEQLHEALSAIKRGAEEQRELIEDLVDTARIATGKLVLTKEPTDLTELARTATDTIELTAAGKSQRIVRNFDSVGMVEVDPVRIRQVISNLLSNAVKFTAAGGKIGVEVHRRGENVEIMVTDTGQGFTKEFQGSLFTRFEQASKQSTRAHGGLGIGLSIAKQIVVLHGGTLTGESPGVGLGATFTVRLPLSSLGPTPDPVSCVLPPRLKISPVLRGSKVLLVEDSTSTQRALAAVLEEAGADVITADNAVLALEQFTHETPDLVVSDIGLPEMNGNQFIARLREIERAGQMKQVPALALTAFAGENTAQEALESGFHQCLNKPIEPVELISALAALKNGRGNGA